MTKTSLITAASLAGGALLAFGSTTAAWAYPPGTDLSIVAGDGEIIISNGQPGCTVTVQGEGFSESATLDSDGMAVIDASLPNDLDLLASVGPPPASCESESANGVVRNSGGGGGGGGGGGETPSRTGSDTTLALLAGLGALGVGGGLVVASRRKKA